MVREGVPGGVDGQRAVSTFAVRRGADGAVDAVGMEARGTPVQAATRTAAGTLPGPLARKAAETFGVDRTAAMRTALTSVRRAGTVPLIGVYGGEADPLPMTDLSAEGVTMRMGQADVERWIDDIVPALQDDSDPLGTEDLTTHPLPLDQVPRGYEVFEVEQDGCIEVVLEP